MKTPHRTAGIVMLIASGVTSMSALSLAQSTKPTEAASPSADAVKEAESHFRRGVDLYKEGDSWGALVEFKRTYELAPNYRVLFNLGQTYFQLQRYADALKTLQRFLLEGGSQLAPDRRASIEGDIRQLQTRVAQLDVKVNADGAEVFVDDERVGTSPLGQPVLVSVGRRKISASKAGQVPQERFVDVVAGDHGSVSLEFSAQAPPQVSAPAQPVLAPSPPPATAVPTAPAPRHDAVARPSGRTGMWIAWGITGALGAATAVTGVLTLSAKSDLTNQLNAFPGNGDSIDQARTRGKTLGVVTDALIGGTVVAGGIALYLTLTNHPGSSAAEVGFGPSGIQIRGRY